MPQLSDLVTKKKFVKKEYRPWDLSGTGTVDGKDHPVAPNISKESVVVPEPAISIKAKISTVNRSAITEEELINTAQNVGSSNPGHIISGNVLGNVSENDKVTSRKQTSNITVTNQKQQDNTQVTIREHPGNFKDNVTGNAEYLTYLTDSIKKLSGLQKNIFLYVLNVCSARGALDTGHILSIDLANAANCSIGSAKMSLIRLVEKQLIIRFQGKASRGGHMVLGITKEIQSAAIQAQQALFNPLKISQIDNVTGNAINNGVFYNSSSNINTTTALPETWKKINLEPLRHIGFSEAQLRQLYDCNMTEPEIVQDSINRFSYSLEYSEKAKAYSDPLNVLIGILRKGQRWNEPNYVSQKELALRQLLEEKRKKKERMESMLSELIDIEFPEWRKNLTQAQIEEIVSVDTLNAKIPAAITVALRTYFREKIISPRFED